MRRTQNVHQPISQRTTQRKILERPPAAVLGIVGPVRCRTKPQVPIEGGRDLLARQSRFRDVGLHATGTGPRMYFTNIADLARPDNLARRLGAFVAEALVAHLRRYLVLRRRIS